MATLVKGIGKCGRTCSTPENFDWNVTGASWRQLAKQAISHHENAF
ncbi:MAG: hypothetical protein JOZ31_06935 [Verrucomicrobia bacterium]|nr:hypothetical protein [Verrucomicrobiota bacterium]MBV8485767.1 hypothetical protein [Verrucomicrobiota bacterium]